MTPQSAGFVCAMNRNRDNYQVPLALFEAGLLARFVTDFYAPDRLVSSLSGGFVRRHVDGLPSATSEWSLGSLITQTIGLGIGLPPNRVFALSDALLARTAGRAADRLGANLYCYASYLPAEADIPRGAQRTIFEYHPLPSFGQELLRADLERYPQVARSHAEERASVASPRVAEGWRRSDAVVCASSVTRRSLIEAGCDEARITVVPYGFEAPEKRVLAGVGDSPPRRAREFLFVGQGIQRKGLHHLIDAWQRAGLPDARLTLVCYRIDPGIRAMIRSPSVTLLGRQSRAELEALYARSDVFVMPSLVEGFGLTYLEAMAHGCHVVATDNTGIPDLNLPCEAATVIEPGNLDALCDTLSNLAARRFDRVAIRAAARARPWTDFRSEIGRHARLLAR